MKIHKAAVKSLAFSLDKIHLISGSDDKTVCLWDISTGDLIWQSKNNSDLIRSVAISNSGNFFASGSYDHSVQIRTLATSKAIVKLDHGSPVEAITFFPNEKYMATAGLSSVKIWEINTSSSENEISAKLVKELIVHHKTISAVHVTSDSKYMITSSLDHSSKIIKIEDDSIAHQFKFKSAIVSMFISNDYHSIAYGLTGGEVVFLRFKPFGKLGSELPSKKFTEFYDQSTSENISFNILKSKNIRLHRVDKFLKLFRYGAALDVVVNLNRVDAFISIIGELLRRRGLIIALSGRNLSEIILIINMIARAIPNPKYQSLAIEAAFALIDVYGPTSHQSNSFKDSIRLLRDHLTDIISSCVVSLKLYGQLESISDILP